MENLPRPVASSLAARHTMQANRGKDSGPELALRRLLRDAGFPGYRLHWKGAAGHPDVAYPGRKVAVFVHGCYWHRCPHCAPPMPKRNSEFWAAKFVANERRDERNAEDLARNGWTVITVWECRLRQDPDCEIARITAVLNSRG